MDLVCIFLKEHHENGVKFYENKTHSYTFKLQVLFLVHFQLQTWLQNVTVVVFGYVFFPETH